MSPSKVLVIMIAMGMAVWARNDEWSILYRRASDLRQAGNYTEAAVFYREAAIASEQRGDDPSEAAVARNCLGMLDDAMGSVSSAEDEYRRSLALFERAGADHTSDYALALNNLGAHYSDLGHLSQAESLFRKSIAVFDGEVPPSIAGLALARGALGVLLTKEGHYARAEVLLTQAVSSLEDQPEHALRLAFELENLGTLRKCQRRYEDATTLLRRALSILRREVGPNHPVLLDTLNNLGVLECNAGDYAEADGLFRQTLDIAKSLGADTAVHAHVLMNYSTVLRKQGRTSMARKAEEEGRSMLQRSARASGTAFTVDSSALRK